MALTEFQKAFEEAEPPIKFTFDIEGVGGMEATADNDELVASWLLALGTLILEHGCKEAFEIMMEYGEPEDLN